MPITLTTPQTLTNGTRLVVTRKRWHDDEDGQIITYDVSLRTAPGGTPADGIVAQLSGEIRAPSVAFPNGRATVVAKNGSFVAGSPLQSLLQYNASIAVSAGQFASALTALKANAATFEAHLLTAGYLHSSLAGT